MRRALAIALVVQVALAVWAVAPRLLPRVNGDEYRIVVEPVDPIEPLRGAYVDLSYGQRMFVSWRLEGRRYVRLTPAGPGAWRFGTVSATRPDREPFLRCVADDGRLRCGIESFFASQREARRLERELGENGAFARVKIDGAGRAVIVGLEPR